LDVLKKELGQLSRPTNLKRSIVVDVEAPKSGTLTLTVSYLVRGASWRPVYEARTHFEKAQVELILYGIVRQTTGEDWSDVDVILSTAKPTTSGKMPEVSSWTLRPYQPPQDEPYYRERMMFKKDKSAMLTARRVSSEQLTDAAVGAIGGSEEKAKPQEAAFAVAASEQKGVSVIYKILRKASLKSDGSDQRLPVVSESLAAKFKYAATPRASLSAYLSARVTNGAENQLLPGRVNIFLEGDFVGASEVSGIGPGEEFDLSLGIDENVKIKKEEIEKKTDDIMLGGIPSPNRKVTTRYKLTAENYKNKRIVFELFDSLPVSQDERIKVRIDKVSPEPKDKDWKDKKGVWRWEFSLEPKAKQEIFYTVVVERPRNMQVEGL